MLLAKKIAKYWIDNGILLIKFKNHSFVNLFTSFEMVKDRLRMQDGKDFPVLCDIRGIKNIDQEAINFLALEGVSKIKALAIIIHNPLDKVVTDIILTHGKRTIPTRIFSNEMDAKAFLKPYVKKS